MDDVEISQRLQAIEYVLQAFMGTVLAGLSETSSSNIKNGIAEFGVRAGDLSGQISEETAEDAGEQIRDYVLSILSNASATETAMRNAR